MTASDIDGPYATMRLAATVENTSTWSPEGAADRDAALPRSLVAAHLLLGLGAGSFLSMTDPPEWAKGAVAACRNEHAWPVLAGEPGRADVVLSSPIILEDHPAIAPESPGALYDALEIDEILALRTAALTDQEKREARGTDPRAAEVIDLAESMPPEVLERLHGAVRALREVTGPGPHAAARPRSPTCPVRNREPPGGIPRATAVSIRCATGSPLRAVGRRGQPGAAASRASAGRTPRTCSCTAAAPMVEAVLHDVDGGVHLAVTVEGDPGVDIRARTGPVPRTSNPTRSPRWRTRERRHPLHRTARTHPDRRCRQHLPR